VTLLGRTVSGLEATVVAAVGVLGAAVNAGATAYVAESIAIALVNHPVRRWRGGRSAIAARSWSVVLKNADATRVCSVPSSYR
jgi:hypothetical protein